MPDAGAAPARPRLRTSAILAWLLSALVLAQAALAGRFLTTDPSLVKLHRIIAEASAPVGLALLWAAFTTRPANSSLRVASALLLILLVAQTGLGFVGRTSPQATSLHVPLGVALFGLAIVTAMLARPGPSMP